MVQPPRQVQVRWCEMRRGKVRHDRCSVFKVSTLVPCAHIQWFDDLTIFKAGRNSSEYAEPIWTEKEKREWERQTDSGWPNTITIYWILRFWMRESSARVLGTERKNSSLLASIGERMRQSKLYKVIVSISEYWVTRIK